MTRLRRTPIFVVALACLLATVQPEAVRRVSEGAVTSDSYPLTGTDDSDDPRLISARAEGAVIYPVRATQKVELAGTGSATHIGWAHAPHRRPGRVRAFVAARSGGRQRVNPKGTRAWAGDFDGNLFIYQQVRRGQSNIKLFNLRRNRRRNPPGAVNTKQWESDPSLSGRRILFGRERYVRSRDASVARVMLFNSVTRRMERLDRAVSPATVNPGQVNGRWAVWDRCTRRPVCNAFLYNVRTKITKALPNTQTNVYAPSVLAGGTTYFVRSAPGCGEDVRLFERTRDGAERVIFELVPGWDIFESHAFVNPDGGTTVYFDLGDCERTTRDVYGVDVPALGGPDQSSDSPLGSPSPTQPGASPTPSSAPGAPDQDLPTLSTTVAYQGDPSHSGVLDGVGLTPPLTQKWQRDMGQPMSYPLIADGRAFVIVRNESEYGTSLHALDLRTGDTLWQRGIGGTYYWANAAYEAGTVFVQNYNGALLALDAATGAIRWTTDLPGQRSFSSPPTVHEGLLYAGGAGSGGTLYAVDAADGAVRWTRSVANGDHSSPALSRDRVFVSYSCPNIYGFDRLTGSASWTYSQGCSGGGGRTPVYDLGRVYVRDGTEGFVLESHTGKLLDVFGAGPIPALDDGDGYFVFGGRLEARSASGVTRWVFDPDEKLVSAPFVVDGHVYVGSASGTLYVLRATDGALASALELGGSISSPDEHNVSKPLTGFGAGEGMLLVPHGTQLTALGS